MAAIKTLDVRCPRCATKIQLDITYSVRLIQTVMGRTSIITADTSVSGVGHTCPSDIPDGETER